MIYIGHLPFGFEEFQVADFFKQFGEVSRSYVSRSPKVIDKQTHLVQINNNFTVNRLEEAGDMHSLNFQMQLLPELLLTP